MKECCGMVGDGSYDNTGFIVKWPCKGGPQQDSWRLQLLTDWEQIKEVGGEVPGRSLDRIIFSDPLTFPR
jgi:hypothetical protein